MTRFSLTLLGATVAALSLSGCPDMSTPEPRQPGHGRGPDTPPGTASTFMPLSEHDQATFTDLAVGPDGTLHALYRGTATDGGFQRQLLYRTSRDDGASWTAPAVMSAGGPHRHAGLGRLAFDAQGRLYAIWKSAERDDDSPSGALVEGTLMVRCLDQGVWSDPFQVGAQGQTISWFAAPGPGGELVLVWNAIQPIPGAIFSNTLHSGLIQRIDLRGTQAGAPQELVRSAVQGGVVDGFQGLSGHVTADGTVRWLAQRLPAGRGGAGVEVVYGIDGHVTRLFALSDYYADENQGMTHPPQLLWDAASTPHVVLLSDRAGPPRVIDMPLRRDGTVTELVVADEGGQINSFNAEQGPGGTMAVVTSLKMANGISDVFDLYASTYAGDRWQLRGNLTNNQATEKFLGASTSTGAMTSSVRFNSQFAAPSLDQSGGFHVLFVNTRTGWVTQTERGTLGGQPASYTHAGGSATPMVYFTRL